MRQLQIVALAAFLGVAATPVLGESPQADPKQHLREVFDRATEEAVDLDEMESALGLNGLRLGEWSKVAPYGNQPRPGAGLGTPGAPGQPGGVGTEGPTGGSAPQPAGLPPGTGDAPTTGGGPIPIASPSPSDVPLQPEPELIVGSDGQPPVKVPLPASAWLLGVGLFSLAVLGTRRRFLVKRQPV